jgi:hypothetical protein
MEVVEGGTLTGDGVNMRRLEDGMAIAAKPVGPLLIGDEKKKIWLSAHRSPTKIASKAPFEGRALEAEFPPSLQYRQA